MHLMIVVVGDVVCYGAFSLVSVPFWDDWVLIGHASSGLWDMFSQLGRREQYFLLVPFVALGEPLIWAAASFICWGIVAVSIYGVVSGLGWGAASAFWAALLTAAFPLNQARFALAVLPYSFCAALFAVALLLLVRSVNHRSVWPRIMAAGLLLLSFTTSSFLTLTPLAFAVVFLALRLREPQKDILGTVRGTAKYWELFALPVLYWVTKSWLQPVYGVYANYNQFRMGPIEGLLRAPLVLMQQLGDLPVLFPTSGHLLEAAAIAVLFTALLLLCIRLMRIDVRTRRDLPVADWVVVLALLAMAVLAVFPYVMVGLRPSFGELWDTRHQTTLAIIAGMLAFSIIRASVPSRLVPACCATLLCVFITVDVSVSRQLMADIADSTAIIHSPQIANIPDGTLVAVHADNESYRMMARDLRFYELSAMLNAHASQKAVMAMLASSVVDPATGGAALPGSEVLPQALAKTCAQWVARPEYGFGDIGEVNQFAEMWLTPKLAPPTYLESLMTVFGLIFDRQATIDRLAADLMVTVQFRPGLEVSCAGSASG